MLDRSNKSLSVSNRTLLQDNTLFHYKIEQIEKLIDMVTWKANELWVKAFMIGNNIHKYKEYLSEVLAFIKNVANRGVTFE
jgi:hypothetical protein